MIGGRNFEPAARTTFTVALDGATRDSSNRFRPGLFSGSSTCRRPPCPGSSGDYFPVTVTATPPARVAVEQFDVSSARPVVGYGDGWHEQELNPRTGLRWRWLSERGELRLRAPTARADAAPRRRIAVDLFLARSRLVVRSGDRIVFDQTLSAEFSLNIPIEAAAETISLETDQVFAPADRSRRSADRRHLGLRIFKCELRPAQ